MPLINGIKFACNSCIKGHRSSHCNHVERPLFEIRRKGRPVTQCTYCRDLRKTKQVHVKCACGDRKVIRSSADASPSSSKTILSSSSNNNSFRNFSPPQSEPLFLEARGSATTVTAAGDCPTTITTTNVAMGGDIGSETLPTSSSSSFSWAWISPQQPPQQHLGFVFQKPQGEQSVNDYAITPSTSTTMTTRPFRQISPAPAVPAATTPLPTVISTTAFEQNQPQQHFAPTSTASTGLVSITTTTTAVTPPPPPTDENDPMVQQLLNSLMARPSNQDTTTIAANPSTTFSQPPSIYQHQSMMPQQHTPPPPQAPATSMCRGGCCSCPPTDTSMAQGESVVITITPLPKQQGGGQQDHTTATTMTRVVTCYCGPSCICPDCLVHPVIILIFVWLRR
ncbi:predicted protein [Lichtheimia corymbifera JMRC:FSU:9682]|uniref:Copper-fist domain-containing protein n=1 Tax=Lichtheimia corymbifera JMRC:FSU:9682 TaxID=1263082 RepID=A0A068S1L8_9FUNG|nr:predicted protein [Lichtheimia corymbifera JMRC:FSU:9682]